MNLMFDFENFDLINCGSFKSMNQIRICECGKRMNQKSNSIDDATVPL